MKQISNKIDQIDYDQLSMKYNYVYSFEHKQDLEDIDDYNYFGIHSDTIKENVINGLVEEFRIHLENTILN